MKPRRPFDVLVMSEESRLGREAIETAYALKQLIQAGVRVFFYLEDRERTFDSPTDKLLMSVTAFADELEREKARQRTYDAMQRKARAGHVTGGRVFGYDNIEITGPDGQRSHVERRINKAEATVVRRMFTLCAEGAGLTRITKLLNADGVPAPRPQQGRPRAWIASSVRAVLRRPLYRGEIRWNASQKRDRWGQQRQHARPEADWIQVAAPHLRIIPDDLWRAAQARLAERRDQYAKGDRAYRASPYLLSGFARCALCGGGFASHTRQHGSQRAYFYGCVSHWKRGPEVCANGLIGRMDAINAEVLATLRDDILRPTVVERAVALVLEDMSPRREAERLDARQAELVALDGEYAELTRAIERGGAVNVLVALVSRLQALQARREVLVSSRPAVRVRTAQNAPAGLERRIREKVADWRGLLTRDTDTGRDVLRVLLAEPLRFAPVIEPHRRGYRFTGAVALDRVVEGVITLRNTDSGGVPNRIPALARAGRWCSTATPSCARPDRAILNRRLA